jgi:TetR/AcrR family transcriptional regulator, transcriptional repressor for nem operon
MKPAFARQSASDVPGTFAQILDVAERLAQTRGFNGFSYADIAAELGITKASLHYHFPSKATLGRAIIDRYSAAFIAALTRIAQSESPAPIQLERYVAIYADVLKGGRICLCGMLAAEYTTLQKPMQDAIRGFFDLNEHWLTRVLESGRANGTLAFDGTAQDAARVVMSALEGALLLARPYGGAARFATAAARLLREFASPAPHRLAEAGKASHTRRAPAARRHPQPRALSATSARVSK